MNICLRGVPGMGLFGVARPRRRAVLTHLAAAMGLAAVSSKSKIDLELNGLFLLSVDAMMVRIGLILACLVSCTSEISSHLITLPVTVS